MRTILGHHDIARITKVRRHEPDMQVLCTIIANNSDHLVIRARRIEMVVMKSLLGNSPNYIAGLVPGVETVLLFNDRPSRSTFYNVVQR